MKKETLNDAIQVGIKAVTDNPQEYGLVLMKSYKVMIEITQEYSEENKRLVEALGKIVRTAPIGLGGWDALLEAKQLLTGLKQQ